MNWKLAGAAAMALSVAGCSSGPSEWFSGSSSTNPAPVTSAQYPVEQAPSSQQYSRRYSSNMEHYRPSTHHGSRTVREAQEALNQRGFNPGPIDGIYGPRTASAIESFQRANSMQATGRLDRQVEQALNLPEGSSMTGSDMGTPGTAGGGAGSGMATMPAAPGSTNPSR